MPLADPESQRTHEHIGAMLFLAAVPLSIPGLLAEAQRAPILAEATVVAAAAAGVALLLGGRLGRSIRGYVPETGALLLSVGIASGGTISQYYAILYVWIALAAGLFQPRRRILLSLTLVAAGSAISLAISMDDSRYAAVRWTLVVATCIGTSVAAAWLVRRYEVAQEAATSAQAQAERMSLTDSLTGLANRRHVELALEQALATAQRARRPVAVLLVDIDHFKDINDRRGHGSGDAALTEVSRRIVRATRAADVVARWGGDEFLVVLGDATDVEAVATAAERIRHAIAATQLVDASRATVSVGGAIAVAPEPGLADELTDAADGALYQAKRDGRDRIVITTTPARLRAAG